MTIIEITTINGVERVIVNEMVIEDFEYKVDKKNGIIKWDGLFTNKISYWASGEANSWRITRLTQI